MTARVVLFFIWAGALALAAPHDLSFSTAVAQPEHPYAQLIYHHGTWPSGFLYAAAIIWLSAATLRGRSNLVSLMAAVLLAHALIHPLLITSGLKFLFGRLRFHQLPPGGAGFTPFYLPTPGLGGRSFPSGHVASAVVLTPLVVVSWRERRRGLAAVLASITVVWGLSVAWGRILHGAHYLTDCIFSLGFSPLIAPLTIRVGAWYRDRFE